MEKFSTDDIISLLPTQYTDSDIEKIIENVSSIEDNEVQQAIEDLFDKFWIDTATGDQLDKIGEYYGIKRFAYTDSSYKVLINSIIHSSKSQATREEFINAVKFLYEATFVELIENFPAKVMVYQNSTTGLVIPYLFILKLSTTPGDEEQFILDDGSDFYIHSPNKNANEWLLGSLPVGVRLIELQILTDEDANYYEMDDGKTLTMMSKA